VPPPPLFDVEAFRKELARNGPRRAYLFSGKEPYLHRLAIGALKTHYGAEGYEVHFPPRRGEPPLPLRDLLAELISPGLFGESKLIVFMDAGPMLESKPQVLLDALAGTGEGTVAVSVSSGRIPAPVKKAFAHHGELYTTRKLYEKPGSWVRNPAPEKAELASWVVLRAKARGKQLAPMDAWELIQRLGTELADLDQAVEKLSLACPGKKISAEAVRSGVGHHRHYQVFELADSVLLRKREVSLRLARRSLLEEAENPEALLLVLIAVLRKQLDQLLRALELGSRPTAATLQQKLGINNKWQADRILARLQLFRSPDEALGLRRVLFEADRDFKMGLAPADWLVERVVYAFTKA